MIGRRDDGSGSAGSIKVDIGRASAVAVVMAVRVIGYAIAGLCGLLLLAFVTAIPRLLKRRGLEFDGQGVHFWYGQERLVLPWSEVAAVGIGYEQPPDLGWLGWFARPLTGGLVR